MNDERLIITGLEFPITDVKELHRITQTCYTEGRKDGAIAELEKIKAEINEYLIASFADDEDFRWFNLCLDSHIAELKGENNE